MRKKIVAILCLGALSTGYAGTTPESLSLPFNNVGVSARGAALGSAYVSVVEDSSALLWNAAGLGKIKTEDIWLNHNNWFVGTYRDTITVGWPLGEWGGIGAGIDYIDYGSFELRNSAQVMTGIGKAYSLGGVLGWGREILEGLEGGVSLRGAEDNLNGEIYRSLSGDAGLLLHVLGWNLGASYTNIGSGLNWSTQGSTFKQVSMLRLGGSYGLQVGKDHEIVAALSGHLEHQGVNRLGVGIEDKINAVLALRAGYLFNLPVKENYLQGLKGLTAGAGFMYKGLSLDYAYIPYGDLGDSHQVSLNFRFGNIK